MQLLKFIWYRNTLTNFTFVVQKSFGGLVLFFCFALFLNKKSQSKVPFHVDIIIFKVPSDLKRFFCLKVLK